MPDSSQAVTFYGDDMLDVSQPVDIDDRLELIIMMGGPEIMDIILDQQDARCIDCLKHG